MDSVSSRPRWSGTQSFDNQQSQVRYGYGEQPRCSGGGNLQGQGEDGLLQDARKLCALFKKQESVTNEINASLTDMCMQLVADNASQVREAAAAPMRVCGPEPVEGRGRG